MPTITQFKSGSTLPGATLTVTFDNPTVNGNSFFVLVQNGFTGTPPNFSVPPDSKGNTYTQDIESGNGPAGAQFGVSIFRSFAGNGGSSHSIQIDSDQSGFWGVYIVEVQPVGTISLDFAFGNNQVDTAPNPGFVTNSDVAIRFGIEADNQGSPITATPAGWTLFDVNGNFIYRIDATPVSNNPTWTIGVTANWFCVQGVYLDVGSGGGGNPWNAYAQQ